MKRFFWIFGIEIFVSLFLGLSGHGFKFVGFGIAAMVIGAAYFLAGLCMPNAGGKNFGAYFISSGLLLF